MPQGSPMGRHSRLRKSPSRNHKKTCKTRPSSGPRTRQTPTNYKRETNQVRYETAKKSSKHPSSYRTWYKNNLSVDRLVYAKKRLRDLGHYNPQDVVKDDGSTVTREAQLNSSWVSSEFVAAVRAFQEANGLNPDGLLGSQSMPVLETKPTKLGQAAPASTVSANRYGGWIGPQSPGNIPMQRNRDKIYVDSNTIAQNKEITELAKNKKRLAQSLMVGAIFGYDPYLHGFVPFQVVIEEIVKGRKPNPFKKPGDRFFVKSDLMKDSVNQYGLHPAQRIGAGMKSEGNIADSANQIAEKMYSNPELTKRVYRYVTTQGDFKDFVKNQNIISCLVRGDGQVTRNELVKYLSDFDASGIVQSKVNGLLPEHHALNYLDSQSYGEENLIRFIKKAIASGGGGQVPFNNLKDLCRAIALEPGMKQAFESGSIILAKNPDGTLDPMFTGEGYESVEHYQYVQEQLKKHNLEIDRPLTEEEKKVCRTFLETTWKKSEWHIMSRCGQICKDNEEDARKMYQDMCSDANRNKCINNMIEFSGMHVYKVACACTGPQTAVMFGKQIGPNPKTRIDFGLAGSLLQGGKTQAGAGLGVNFMPVLQISTGGDFDDYLSWNLGAAITPFGPSASASITKYFDQKNVIFDQNLGTVGQGGANYVTLGANVTMAGPGVFIEGGRDMLKEVTLIQKDFTQMLQGSFDHINYASEVGASSIISGEHCFCDASAGSWAKRSFQGALESMQFDYAPPHVKRQMIIDVSRSIGELASVMRAEQYEGKWRLSGVNFGINAVAFSIGIKFSKLVMDYYEDPRSQANLRQRLRLMEGNNMYQAIRRTPGGNFASDIAKEFNNYGDSPRVTGEMQGENVCLTDCTGMGLRIVLPNGSVLENQPTYSFPAGAYNPIVVDVFGIEGQHSGRGQPTLVLQPARVRQEIDCVISHAKFSGDKNEVVSRLNTIKEAGEATRTKEGENELLWKAINSLSYEQCAELLADPASENLFSLAFNAVVYRLSENPRALETLDLAQFLRLMQHVSVQGKYGLLTRNIAPEHQRIMITIAIQECTGPANNYAQLLEAMDMAFAHKQVFTEGILQVCYDKGIQDPVFMDFFASYLVAKGESDDFAMDDRYPELGTKISEKFSRLQEVQRKKNPEHIYIVAPSSYRSGVDIQGMRDLAKKDPRISLEFCDSSAQVQALTKKHGSVGLIAFGEPWDMNRMLVGADLSNVDHLFTRTCRGQKEWMIDTRYKYPNMCVTVNDHTGYTGSNDAVAEAFAIGLLSGSTETHKDVYGEIAQKEHAYGGTYGSKMTFPHDDISETLRLMDHKNFDPNASFLMSDKAKGKGEIKFKRYTRLEDNTGFRVRMHTTAFADIQQRQMAFGLSFARSADSTGTPERPGNAEGPDTPETPETPSGPSGHTSQPQSPSGPGAVSNAPAVDIGTSAPNPTGPIAPGNSGAPSTINVGPGSGSNAPGLNL